MKTFTTPVPTGFNFWQTVQSHGWAALKPFTYDNEVHQLGYTIQLADQSLWVLNISEPQAGADQLQIAVDGGSKLLTAARKVEIEAAVRWMLRLDEDLTAFHALCATEPRLAHVVGAGYGRVLRSPTAWEDIIRVIATTNTTWTLTKRMVARLVDQYGAPHPTQVDCHAFPTPQTIAACEPAEIQALGWGYRAAYVVENARLITSGKIELETLVRLPDSQLPAKALRTELIKLRGVGDYAAGTLLLLFGHYSNVPVDTAARAAVSKTFYAGGPVSDKQVKASLDPYQPYAALALYCLMMMD